MIIRQAKHSIETWYVSGDSGTEYSVHFKVHPLIGYRVWTCNCPDFTERRQWHAETCKHIDEVQYARSTEPTLNPAAFAFGAASYRGNNWAFGRREEAARRLTVESKLKTVLESVQALLQEIRG